MADTKTTLRFPYTEEPLRRCSVPSERLGRIYTMNPVVPAADLAEEIHNALSLPIGTAPLQDLVEAGSKVALLVDDLTRPTPAHAIVPVVLDELAAAGVEKSDISIVVALGSHRPMSRAEIAAKLGRRIAGEYRVINSRFDEPDHLVHIGDSDDGVRIFIDEEVVRARLRIGIGSIVPHAAVGWSGGGKIIYPGVSGKETVTQFHFTHGLTEQNMTGRQECIVRSRMERWVDIVGLEFIVNCVLTPEHGVHRVVAGHYVDAQREGVKIASRVYCAEVEEQTDIVVAVSYFHDIDFWQATKGIYSGERLVRDGGTLLLLTPCPEGLGIHGEFPLRIGRDDNRQLLEKMLSGEQPLPKDPLPIPPGAMLSALRKRIRCAVVSPGLRPADMRLAGYESFPDAQSGIDALMKRYPGGKISVLMHSDLTFPELSIMRHQRLHPKEEQN
jgi:nickel-dependent lactate racemase